MKKGTDSGEKELIFVYNAYSDLFSKVTDFAHKAISPDTYACNLCRVTYGHFARRREWADFIKRLPYKVSFQYKNERKDLGLDMGLPLVLMKENGETKVILSPKELNSVRNLQEMIDLVEGKLS